MNYTPKQENKNVTAIVVTLIAAGLLIYLLPNFLEIRAVFCQIIAMICLVAAVFLLVRYKTTSFIYSIRPRSMMHDDMEAEAAIAGASLSIERIDPKYLDFVVSKKQGSRAPNMECVLGLSSLKGAWIISPESEYKKPGPLMEKARSDYGAVDFYDYTITLGLKESLLLLFRDGEKHAAIRIEPSEELQNYLIGVAEKNKNKRKSNDN